MILEKETAVNNEVDLCRSRVEQVEKILKTGGAVVESVIED